MMNDNPLADSSEVSSDIQNEASSRDANLYGDYEQFISSSYPSYLRKLGLGSAAAKAEGALITDATGKTYIDCVGGYGLFNVGHNHPKIIDALTSQLEEKNLLTKPLITEVPINLAKLLAEITPGDLFCSFVCNSGSEAIDSALKLARLHSGRKRIITTENSFHGYTLGALSASGLPSFKRFFEPLVPEIIQIPFGDSDALKRATGQETAAFLVEPIQHEAGVLVPESDYFPQVRSICDQTGTLLIFDEIKTGFGKTGWLFASDAIQVVPDMMVVGKSLGGGLIPIGALIARQGLWKKFGLSFPMSASSFAGNTLGCRAALATIDILRQGDLLDDCKRKGAILIESLEELIGEYPDILREVKGMGLLLGVKTVDSQTAFQASRELIGQGILTLPAFANRSVLMIEPPLVISFEQIERVAEAWRTACQRLREFRKQAYK